MAGGNAEKPNKSHFLALAETLPVIVWTAEPDGTVDYISEDFYDLTGLQDLDLAADAWLEALHPDDQEPTLAEWQQRVAARSDYQVEFRIINRSKDQYRWHLVCARPFFSESGELIKWYGAGVDIHERKLAEHALQRAQEQSRLLLESSGVGIHGLDHEGRVIFENQAALGMLGYTRKEIEGQESHPLIHHHRADGSEYPASECPIYRTLRDGKTRSRDDEVFFRKDGSSFPVAYTVAGMTEPDTGKISGAVVNFRDISARRRHAALRSLESHVLDAISANYSLGEILDLTMRSVEEILPGSRAAILLLDNGRIQQVSAPSLPNSYIQALEGRTLGPNDGSCGVAIHSGKQVIVSDTGTDPSWRNFQALAGTHDLAACWSTPVKSGQGGVLATFAIYYRESRTPDDQDQTLIDRISRFIGMAIDRTRQAEKLRESEERFRLVSRATSDVVWDWDLVNNIVWWSDGMAGRFGHDPESLPTGVESWKQFIHPDDIDRVVGSIEASIKSGSDKWIKEYRFKRADGSYALVRDSGHVIRNESGRPARMVGSMVDVTDMRQLEEQLRQSQRLEAIGQLTGGVAHDFNNLLTIILGNAELLEERLETDGDNGRLAGMIRSAATRGAELTNRLLAFARKQMLAPEPVDVNRLIAGMDSMLRRTLGDNIEVEIVRGGGLWPAMADAAQLESTLLNLSLNARDAMRGGGRLTIETANAALDDDYAAQAADVEPGQYVMIAVSDTGMGMDRKTLDQVFEPFFSTKQSGKGTGLGLSMVYGFAKQSGGHVRIYSERGQGTTVKIYLPRTSARVAATEESDVEARTPAHADNKRILVVEDNDLVREHVERSLAAMGYQVVAAANGADALAIIDSDQDIDLLFTDVVMPGGMSGRELADRACELRPGLPVLYTSGYTQNAIVHHGRLDTGVELLQKPYRIEDLAAKIRKVLVRADRS